MYHAFSYKKRSDSASTQQLDVINLLRQDFINKVI